MFCVVFLFPFAFLSNSRNYKINDLTIELSFVVERKKQAEMILIFENAPNKKETSFNSLTKKWEDIIFLFCEIFKLSTSNTHTHTNILSSSLLRKMQLTIVQNLNFTIQLR